MTTTENTKAIIKNFKTIELQDISKRRKTSKVRPYTRPTVDILNVHMFVECTLNNMTNCKI